jgi:hypothetical protein
MLAQRAKVIAVVIDLHRHRPTAFSGLLAGLEFRLCWGVVADALFAGEPS